MPAAVITGVQVGEVRPLPGVSRVASIRGWGQQQRSPRVIMGGQEVVRRGAVIHQVMGGTGGPETRRPGQEVRVAVHLQLDIELEIKRDNL